MTVKSDQSTCLKEFHHGILILILFSVYKFIANVLQDGPRLTCTCGTGTRSRHSCRTRRGWRAPRRCSGDTAGSPWTPGSSRRSRRTRSSGWTPRWAAAGRSSPPSGLGSAAPSWPCASGRAWGKEGDIRSFHCSQSLGVKSWCCKY